MTSEKDSVAALEAARCDLRPIGPGDVLAEVDVAVLDSASLIGATVFFFLTITSSAKITVTRSFRISTFRTSVPLLVVGSCVVVVVVGHLKMDVGGKPLLRSTQSRPKACCANCRNPSRVQSSGISITMRLLLPPLGR